MIKQGFLLLLLFSAFCLSAQVNDTWTSAIINDNMTIDESQNKKWRTGQYGYSAKPKNSLELGLHVGQFYVSGDIPMDLFGGLGLGLHLRKALNYNFSIRVGGMYSFGKGLDGRLSSIETLMYDNHTLVEYISDNGIDVDGYRTYRNFKMKNLQGTAEVLINIGNMLFHKPRNKWGCYLGIGAGYTSATVSMNYFDGTSLYQWSDGGNPNTKAKRDDIWSKLDGTNEVFAENDRDVPSINDKGMSFLSFIGSVGVSRKLSKRVNLTLEHQVWAQDFDKWDGHEYTQPEHLTKDDDQAHYTNLRLGINLGSFNNVTEPLYWLNPLDGTFSDIAALKGRPQLKLDDADGDGVVDMLDQELNTAAGCPVDTRGITLDSDNDGLADCKDKEPYSPPGYEVDNFGVASVPSALDNVDLITENDVNTMIDAKLRGYAPATTSRSSCGEWFLPMIHFDLDKYYIKPEYYGPLHHVAQVMEMCPNMCVTVEGHTDNRNTNDYNRVLSYKRANAAINYLTMNYGISRDRFRLMYGGEDNPLIKHVPQAGGVTVQSQQYMNRRVEFRVCDGSEVEMGRPSGPDAGSGYKSAKSSNYSGNKNSGF